MRWIKRRCPRPPPSVTSGGACTAGGVRFTFAVSAVVVVVLAVGVGLLPTTGRTPSQVAAPAEASAARPGDPAPPGWRTEYYRDLSFEVPDSWVYAYEPGCADEDRVRTRYPGPYVSFEQSPREAYTTCESVERDLRDHVALSTVPPGAELKLVPEQLVRGLLDHDATGRPRA